MKMEIGDLLITTRDIKYSDVDEIYIESGERLRVVNIFQGCFHVMKMSGGGVFEMFNDDDVISLREDRESKLKKILK